ncbi:MAG: PAS domain-containing protein [Verrucomicrobiota bacterium]
MKTEENIEVNISSLLACIDIDVLFDLMPMRVYIKDLDRRFNYINKKGLADLGLERSEAFGKKDEDLFQGQYLAEGVESDRKVLESGRPILEREELECRRDGRPASWVLSTRLPMTDDDGNVVGMLSIVRDIK